MGWEWLGTKFCKVHVGPDQSNDHQRSAKQANANMVTKAHKQPHGRGHNNIEETTGHID